MLKLVLNHYIWDMALDIMFENIKRNIVIMPKDNKNEHFLWAIYPGSVCEILTSDGDWWYAMIYNGMSYDGLMSFYDTTTGFEVFFRNKDIRDILVIDDIMDDIASSEEEDNDNT